MATHTPRIEQHPDLVELHERFQRAASTPAARAIEGLTVLAGLYLAISPWVVGFNGTPSITVSNLVTGIALAVLGLGFGSAYDRTYGMGWLATAIGIWAIITPWIVSGRPDTTAVVASNCSVGTVAAVCGIATTTLAVLTRQRRYGPGAGA